jgi:hypothetical protein
VPEHRNGSCNIDPCLIIGSATKGSGTFGGQHLVVPANCSDADMTLEEEAGIILLVFEIDLP